MFNRPLWLILAVNILLVFGQVNLFASENRYGSLAHYIMALYYDGSGQLDRAVKEYKEAIRIEKDNSLIHLNFAVTLLKKNKIRESREELQLSAQFDPESVEPHLLLVLLNLLQGEISSAAREYEIALKNASRINPKNIEIYKSLGEFYLARKDALKAKDIYKFLCELAPNDPQAHFLLGVAYGELKEYVLCEKAIRKSLELKPDYAQALNHLGYTLVENNRNLREAERLIKKAIKLEPNNGAYLDSLGWLYYKRGRLKDSQKLLERAIEVFPDPVIFDHLGDLFLKAGNKQQAVINWKESLKLDPGQETVRKKIEGVKINE